jgi:hypothetical protein
MNTTLFYQWLIFWIFSCVGLSTALAQQFIPRAPMGAQALESTYVKEIYGKPERVIQVRGEEAIVQNLVMGPEATQLWRRIQTLIASPDIRDIDKLVRLFELQLNEKSKPLDWRDPKVAYGSGAEYSDKSSLIEKARFGIGLSSGPYPKSRFLTFSLKFDLNNFCLSKQEIQRIYPTGDEVTGTHFEHVMWPDKTGRDHGFPITSGGRGGFRITASGCTINFSVSQTIQIIEKEEMK